MIDNQAIAAMSEMLVLIKKYAKNAYPDVETASSNEHRRRAWVITSMLARLAEHMANSDLEAVLSDNVHNTYSERQKYAHAMKQSDRAFMLELHEFKKKAEEYKKRPIKGLNRTDGDIVRCLENLRPLREALCARRADFAGRLGIKLSKKEAREQAAHLARIDPTWAMARDHRMEQLTRRRAHRVLVLGCGSLGSPLTDALARSGVGKIDVVDAQAMASENVGRHLLGLSSVRINKALAVAARLRKEIPGVEITGFSGDARIWISANCLPGRYDLVVDCTAESSVRTFLARTRDELLGEVPLIHAWVEPFCAAAHVIATTLDNPWPSTDPAGARVNVADYSDATVRVKLPACSDGFHPYGSADILQAAGYAAERVLTVLDDGLEDSTVWSFVRAKAFFDELNLPIKTTPLVPRDGTARDGVFLTRTLTAILSTL